MSTALDGIRVLAGPLCGRILADLGAEVAKAESPASEDTAYQPVRVSGLRWFG